MSQKDKTQVLLIGAVIGALTGITAAFLLVQRAEKKEGALTLSAGEGVKVGLGALTFLRTVTDLGK